MMKILGLNTHPDVEIMKMSSFNKRQEHRDFLEAYWVEENRLLVSEEIRTKIELCDDFVEFVVLVKDFIKWNTIRLPYNITALQGRTSVHKWVNVASGHEKEMMEAAGKEWSELEGDWEFTGDNLEDFMYHLKALVKDKPVDSHIKATTPGILDPIQRMYIYTNIIDPIDINDSSVRLLKLVNTKGLPFKTTQEEFNHLTYIPLAKGKLSMIEILITDESGLPVPFQNGTVVLTLHFRKVKKSR